MKRITVLIAAVLLSIGAMAQSYTIDGLIEAVNTKRVRLDFTIKDNNTNFSIPGTLVINGQKYSMYMMGISTISDGNTTWIKNGFGRELTIEVAQPIPPLKALAKNIKDFKCEDGKISGVFVMGDQSFSINAYNIAITDAVKNDSTFTFDESTLSSDWVITDTRE